MSLPPCGFYRTTMPIGPIPEGRLVYFHNHGDPGPGIYVPADWNLNRAVFAKQGTPLPAPEVAATLEPLAPEGLYRVDEEFTCCEKECRIFRPGQLVQLGYNGAAGAILFDPQWSDSGLVFPKAGQSIDRQAKTVHLSRLTLAAGATPGPSEKLH